jgi:hypothetical protein
MWGVQPSRVYRIRGPAAKGRYALGIEDPTLRRRYPCIDDIVPKNSVLSKNSDDLRSLPGVLLVVTL